MRSLILFLVVTATSLGQTYSGEVRHVLVRNCVGCHNVGGVAPMPFVDYQQVRPWAAAIREAVVSGAMPPWHATPGTAHAFRNDRSLSASEKNLIRSWVDHGAPEGEPTHALAPMASDAEWKLA